MGKSGFLLDENFELDTNLSVKKSEPIVYEIMHKEKTVASEICQCFDIPQVKYREHIYQGEVVTESDIITSKEYSMVSKMAFDIYAHSLRIFSVS